MTITAMEEIERRVLATCLTPAWSQSLKPAKAVVDRLVAAGHLRRHPAIGSKVPLMVSITASGQARLRDLRKGKSA